MYEKRSSTRTFQFLPRVGVRTIRSLRRPCRLSRDPPAQGEPVTPGRALLVGSPGPLNIPLNLPLSCVSTYYLTCTVLPVCKLLFWKVSKKSIYKCLVIHENTHTSIRLCLLAPSNFGFKPRFQTELKKPKLVHVCPSVITYQNCYNACLQLNIF